MGTRLIDVFVSYAEPDAEWARELAQQLGKHGLRVFFDEWSVLPGGLVRHELEVAIRRASSGIAIISPASVGSNAAMAEHAVLYAESATRGLRFIPVLIGGAAVPSPFAGTRVWRDFHNLGAHEYQVGVKELADTILGWPAARDDVPAETFRATQPSPPEAVTEPDQHTIVVCYVAADQQYGQRLTGLLRASGLPVWSIADLRPGDPHFLTIRQQLRYAIAVIVLMSPESQNSADITRMIIEGQVHGRPFVPILLHGERNYHLAHTWYFDATNGEPLGPGELAILKRLRQADDNGTPVDVAKVLPPPLRHAPVRAIRIPWATALRQLDELLTVRDFEHADLQTTAMLLAAANRLEDGWLRQADGVELPVELLSGVDALWRRHSHQRQGFRAQLDLARVGGGRHADFLRLSVALGWRASTADTVPRYHEGFDSGLGRAGFFPTLRNPQNEHYMDWYDQWTATALAVHRRLIEWEGT